MASAQLGDHPFFVCFHHVDVQAWKPFQFKLELSKQSNIVLADSTGESQNIRTAQAGGHGADQLQKPVFENGESPDRTVVSCQCLRTDFLHVSAQV